MRIDVLHVSTEYFPAAKAGGLADVVGALPKYLNNKKFNSKVIIPKHSTKWIKAQKWKEIDQGSVKLLDKSYAYSIQEFDGDEHPLLVVDLPGLFDRASIYINKQNGMGYEDEVERNICFQVAVMQWLNGLKKLPKVLHCHDHHTGLIPFYIKHGTAFKKLSNIPSVFTIHNGAYHGSFAWSKSQLLPAFDFSKKGLLDWNNMVNPLATGVKCCWKLTTVSPGYMEELRYESNGLETLIENESAKSSGVLNGIDQEVWNPATDELIASNLADDLAAYKKENKLALLKKFKFDSKKAVVTFIGRFAHEKGVQLIPDLICRYLAHKNDLSFLILGTGDKSLEGLLAKTKELYPDNVDLALEYNEGLAHQLYAGSDFLIMPSKVEPCGLNQMYAMRYGTIPIVHGVGGLKDTVMDLEDKSGKGYGFRFDQLTVFDGFDALKRAAALYNDQQKFESVRKKIVNLDFSWNKSASLYKHIYKEVLA